MSLPTYINVHSHKLFLENETTLSILNKYDDFDRFLPGQFYSLGIHPWYIHDATGQLATLRKQASNKQVTSIGECGLDRIRGVDFSLQESVFKEHIDLANHLQKPLIIHCVKAYEESLSILQAATVPVIFHGFNKKIRIAKRILKQGYYLSFGAALLSSQSVAEVFAAVLLERIFLETDDADTCIKDIYARAAAVKGINERELILQLQQNYKTVFKQ